MPGDQVPPGRPAGPTMGRHFGDMLRRAREARSLALEAVSVATRIAVHHLRALERGDLDALPPGPFGKGYVRAYAQFLNIDPEPILEAYRAREGQRGQVAPGDDARLLKQLSRLVDQRSGGQGHPAVAAARWGSLGVVFVLLCALSALWWLFGRAGDPGPGAAIPRPPPASERAPAPAAALAEPVEPRPPAIADAQTPDPALPTSALEVPEHGVGIGLVARRLVGQADRFAEGTTVAFWTRVVGGRRGHVIRHVWFREGRAAMRADLPIGGPHWRTHSRLLLPPGSAGRWAVEARTSDGRLLARTEFVCEPLSSVPDGPAGPTARRPGRTP